MSHSPPGRPVLRPALLLLALALPVLSPISAVARTVYGDATGNGYAELFAEQPGRVFTAPTYSERGRPVRNIYVSEDDYARGETDDPRSRFQPYLDGQDLDVWIAYEYVAVDDRRFRFADAMAFDGEISAPHHPMYADLYVAPGHGNRPAMLCIESHPGDEDAGVSTMPIFVLIEPLSAQARLYRLPGLFTSCAAVTATPDGRVLFPAICYLRDAHGQPTGVRIDEYRIDGESFVHTGRTRSARFVAPSDPFRFVMDSP